MCLIKRIMKKINSIELGRLCGVSQGTVYRALHNKGRVSEKTKEKVLKMAKKYNYRSNPLANEIIRGKSNLVGAVVPVLDALFYIDLLNIIRNKLSDLGFTLLIATADNEESMVKILDEFNLRNFNSAIIIPSCSSYEIPEYIYAHLKLISLVNPICCAKNILPNEIQCGVLGTEYLIEKNHKNIIRVYGGASDGISDKEGWAVEQRNEGYQKTMKSKKLNASFLKIPFSSTPKKDTSYLQKQLTKVIKDEKPSAFFCHNDMLANRVINALSVLGFKVPDDFSVLGTDANQSFLQINSQISSVLYPMEEIASQCVDYINGKTLNEFNPNFKIYYGETVNILQTVENLNNYPLRADLTCY